MESKFGGVLKEDTTSTTTSKFGGMLKGEAIQPIQDPQIAEQLGTSMYGPTEVIYEGFAEPIIMGSAMMGDVAVNSIIGIADFLGNDRFVAELNARKDTGNMPSDIANQIRADIKNTLNIEDPVERGEIAKQKSAEYLKVLTYYKMAQPFLQLIPGLKTVDKMVVGEIAKRPLLFTAGEAAGIGAETEVAYRGGGPMAQGVAGAATSVSVPGLFNLSKRVVQKLTGGELLKQYGQSNFNKASDLLQGFATKSPDEIAETIRQYESGNIPLEIITGDEGFTSLERALVDEIPTLQLNKRDKEYLLKLSENFTNRKNVKNAADFLRAEKKRHKLSIDSLISLNEKKGLQQLSELSPNASAEEIQESVFQSLNKSLEQAQGLENEVWLAANLDKSAFKYPKSRKAFQELKKSLRKTKAKDMPPDAIEFLSEPGKMDTVGDLYGLYSTLGEYAVIARSNKQFNTARVATELRKAIFEDLDKIPGAGPELQRAKDVSRMVNERFNKGVVGRILSYSREGAEAIDPSLILKKTFKKGQEGKLSFEQLTKAVSRMGADEMAPQTLEEFQLQAGLHDYIRTRFADFSTSKGGVINPDRAQQFLEDNKQLLDVPEYAPLKAQLESAKDTADVFRAEVKDLKDLYSHRFGTKGEKSFGKFIGASSSNRMKSILSGGNPAGEMKELLDLINKSPINTFKQAGVNKQEVLQGVKDSIYEYISSFGTKSGDFELLTVESVLKNPEVKQAIDLVLDPSEIKNVDKFVKELKKFNEYKLTESKVSAANTLAKQSFFTQFAAIGTGLITGKLASGPGALMAVSSGKRTATEVLMNLQKGEVIKILNDAMKDPKLLEALMMNNNTYNRKGFARKRNFLNKYLISRGIGGFVEGQNEEKLQKAMESQDEAQSAVLQFLNPFSEQRMSTTPGLGRIQELMK
jgi:hypothetical protein